MRAEQATPLPDQPAGQLAEIITVGGQGIVTETALHPERIDKTFDGLLLRSKPGVILRHVDNRRRPA